MVAKASPRAGVWEDVWLPTTCDMCFNHCNIRVRRVDGVAVKIEGLPGAPPNLGKTCAKGNSGLMNLYSPHRIKSPLIRTNPHKGIGVDPGWKEISWDEALKLFAHKVKAARERDPRTICLASFDTTSGGFSASWMGAIGSPNLTTVAAGYFCGNGMHPVAFAMTGAFDTHADIGRCNYCMIFGSSYGFVGQRNAMGLAQEMADARMRGMKLVVVDPMCNNAAAQADEWLPIRPGTDAALALTMMYVLIHERGLYDREYLQRYTNATYLVRTDGRYVRDPATGKPLVWDTGAGRPGTYDAVEPLQAALEGDFLVHGVSAAPGCQVFKQHLRDYTPERAAEITTLPAATIRRIANEFGDGAQIGSTIELDGYTLPLRPAVAMWYRGVSAHQHGMHNGMALALLNVMVGAVDVPGGLLHGGGAAGPGWMPEEGPDGLLVQSPRGGGQKAPHRYDFKVRKPETLEMVELFPLAIYARAMVWLGVLDGERFGIDYKPEVLINCRTNLIATGAEPEIMAEALRRIPFIVCMSVFHDEGTEFADLLLPDQHGLERLVPEVPDPYRIPNPPKLPLKPVAYQCQLPVVEPQGQARYWIEVLFDVADRIGILPELYSVLNARLYKNPEYRLDPSRKYTFAELFDRSAKTVCGDQYGYEYFKQEGVVVGEKFAVPYAYPRIFHRARMPLYLEHFIEAGEQVSAYMHERGIEWDISDYVPLVHWKPCPSYAESPPEYDLFVVNQKLSYMTHSFTAENPWLTEIADHSGNVFPVTFNEATARRKGIKDGDPVQLETPEGLTARGIARLTQGIHPECVNVPGVLGRWVASLERGRKGVNFNSLLGFRYERLDTVSCALDACVKVKVRKHTSTTPSAERTIAAAPYSASAIRRDMSGSEL